MLQESSFTDGRNLTQSTVFLSPHKQGVLWVAVFDSQTAKIFEKNTGGFDILYKLDNKPAVDDGIDKDSIGSAGAYGQGRHGYEPSMEESRQVELAFARSLSDWLERARQQKKFDALALVAAPRMLGELRDVMPKTLAQCVILTKDKELVNHAAEDLEKMLLKITGKQQS